MIVKIELRDIWTRWWRVFPVALNFDELRIYNKKEEFFVYENSVYEVIEPMDVAGELPGEHPNSFRETKYNADSDVINEEVLTRIKEHAEAGFSERAFRLTESTLEDDAKYIKARESLYNLIAYYMVEEIYEIEQSYGAISKMLESTRNQSHMSQTRKIPPRIEKSVLMGQFGHNVYGYNYIRAVFYGSMGAFSMIN